MNVFEWYINIGNEKKNVCILIGAKKEINFFLFLIYGLLIIQVLSTFKLFDMI